MASSRERYNNIVASEKTTTVSARDRYNALKQIENANDRLVSAVNFINNNAGISSDAITDGSTDIRDVVRSKNITNQATEHINAINDIRSAYDVLERYSKQRGGSLAGYQENSKNLKELKELLTGAKQYGEENSKLLKDVLSGAYAKRLATEQTVQMLESIDTSSPTVFAKQQQYKQNNPNLYALMGGRAYNPIPSVNPTQLTKEDLEKVQTAQAADAKYRDPILRQELKDKMDAAKSMYDDFYKGENDLQTFLNKIGGVGGGEEAREKYKKKYEDAAADYYSLTVGNEEMRKQRISELEREVGILQIKMRENPQSKKSLETQLDEVRAELNGLRTSLYGKATIGEYVGAHALAGADSVSTGVYNTLGLIIGKPLEWIGWKDNPVLKLKEFTQKNHERLQNEALLASKTMGDDYNVGGMLIQGVVAAIPDAALAFATAGTSKAVQLGTKAPGFFAALSRTATNMAKNPMFWSSYVRTLGNDYDSAIEDGASPEAAFIYAQLTSTLNAAVEIGGETGHGGIQTLPDALKNAGKNKSAILEWVTSSLDEGKEEVIQSVISDLNARIIYNSDKKPDIGELAKEGAMGIAVGGILGGGQISANMILNADTRAEYKQIGEVALRQEDFEGIISYARKSVDTDIRALALSSTPQNISAENAGLLYSYVYRDITAAIASPAESATARQNFIDIMRENDSATVQALAGSRYIIRMSEDPQIGEMPTIDNINTESVIDNGENSELQSTANNESAITPNEEATVENLADQAQEVDKVSVAENKSIGFTEPSTKDIYREPTAEERYEAVLGKRKTAKQRHILDVAKALDKNLKVVFVPKNSNVLNDKNGKYVFNTNTMYLAEDLDVVESYSEVFKHEFMHRLELKKAYDSFKAYLFNKSDAFGRYAQTRMAYDDKKKERGTIERTREDAINDLINMYLDNFKGDKKIPQSVRDNFTREKAEREAVADFVARTLFKGNTANLRVALSEDLESLVNMETDLELFEEMAKNDRNLLQKIIDAIRDFINDIKGVPQFKDLEQDLRYIEERLTRVYNSADMINGRSNVDNEVYDIVALENGNTYVKASRNIITGTTIKQQRAQITNFFKKLLKNKPSIDIPTIEGDILTLTMKDTEDKARDNFGTVNGQPVKLSKEEFAVKLRIESHIDEIAETAIKKNKPLTPDVKNHDFAKDGFEYRTAYFEDFDGKYYKIDFSIGHNGTVATVYNIGKIKEDVPPSAKIIAVVGSQALDSSSSTDIIRNKNENVNKNSSNESYFSDNFTTSKDSDGKQLTKAQEVFFKDSASVDDNGNLLVMYQGSQEEFNEFDRKKSSPFNLYGRGFYFTSSKSHAAQYGNVTRAYYLNIKNPVPTYKGDSIITKQQIKKYLEVVAENEDYSIENYGTYDINKIVDSVYGKSDYAMLQDISATAIGDLVEAIELFNKVNGTKFDGLILATETIIFNSEQAKLTTNLNPTESKDIRYSSDDISALQRDLYNRHRNGELTDEEYVEETDKLWEKANETYGTLPKGENAKIDANVPAAVAKDKPTERFIRGIIETDTLKGEALKGMEERTLLGDFSYKVVSDEKAIKTANVAFENGTAESIWEDTVNTGTGITKNKIAIGEALLTNAIKENNTFEILKYSAELADIFTRAGQVVQAARLLKKMTGAGRLVSLQRTVKTLNKDLIKKYGEEFPPIKISEESARRLAGAKTVIGIEQAYQEILQEVADQVPVTFMDKWNAWRYFAMLANPKTHDRNFIGNVIFVPTVRIKDAIAAGIEAATIKDKSKRTKSLVIKKEYRDFAKKDSSRKDVKELLRGNKYNDKTAISEKRKIFKTEALNFLTEFNSNALEAADMLFKNKHYIHALAGFLQARGVDLNNVSNKVLDEARIYAVKEARKATFNDVSAFADAIQRFANKNLAANLLVEGVLPFKRTPINIVKRGIEYSPIGLIKTIAKGILDVKKGKITATEFIDGLASGLTGTGILLAGMLLNSLGYVVGGEDDDDKSQFEKLLGKQEYSVEFLGSSYTIDWAAPACIPFFIGVEIMNSVNENEGFEFSQFFNAVWNSLEPITNLSMLSGIQSVIESTRYADNTQTFSAIAIDSLTSYAMQGIPSLSGAIARTIDPTQRSWYIDKNDKWLDTTAQTVKNNLQSKIPGLTYTQTAKIDAWGRKVSRGGTAERILENFVSPGYYSKINYDEVEQELLRINSVTGESIFPKSASKSFEVNGETKHLSAKEWELYAILKGQYSYKYIKEFKESKYYDKLDDFERTEVIKDLYSFANAKAKSEVSDYDIFSISTYKTAAKYDKNNKLIPYYVSKAIEYVRKKRKEEKE